MESCGSSEFILFNMKKKNKNKIKDVFFSFCAQSPLLFGWLSLFYYFDSNYHCYCLLFCSCCLLVFCFVLTHIFIVVICASRIEDRSKEPFY